MTKFDEVTHPNHSEHKLNESWTDKLFQCNGCNQPGIGSHYTCPHPRCNFDLHISCAISSGPFLSVHHPFQRKCKFELRPSSSGKAQRCEACREDATAYVYHCQGPCKSILHPCCAKLPMNLKAGDVSLFLYREPQKSCQKCGHKGKGWSYRSADGKCNLHVGCAKELIAENWLHGLGHGGSDGRISQTTIPNLNNMIQTYSRLNGRLRRFTETALLVLKIVISAMLGDPSALIAETVKLLLTDD